MGTIMTNGLSQLPEELNADGNAAMNTLLQLAGAVGTAVISTIVATRRLQNRPISRMLLCWAADMDFLCLLSAPCSSLLLLKGVRSY